MEKSSTSISVDPKRGETRPGLKAYLEAYELVLLVAFLFSAQESALHSSIVNAALTAAYGICLLISVAYLLPMLLRKREKKSTPIEKKDASRLVTFIILLIMVLTTLALPIFYPSDIDSPTAHVVWGFFDIVFFLFIFVRLFSRLVRSGREAAPG